jgi:hypothetical protein
LNLDKTEFLFLIADEESIKHHRVRMGGMYGTLGST